MAALVPFDPTTADIILCFGKESIPVHREVFIKSCYFRALLASHPTNQDTKQLKIEVEGHSGKSIKLRLLKVVLKYLYLDTFYTDVRLCTADLMEVMDEAAFFGVPNLVDELIEAVKNNHEDNPKRWAFALLPFANCNAMVDLKEKCLEKLEIKPDLTLKMEAEIRRLEVGLAIDLFSRDSFHPDELLLFNAIMSKIEAARPLGMRRGSGMVALNEREKREYRELLDTVRLCLIRAKDLKKYVAPMNAYDHQQIDEPIRLDKNGGWNGQRGRGVQGTKSGIACCTKMAKIKKYGLRSGQGDPIFKCLGTRAKLGFRGYFFKITLKNLHFINTIRICYLKKLKWSLFVKVGSLKRSGTANKIIADYSKTFSIKSTFVDIPFTPRGVKFIRIYLANEEGSQINLNDFKVQLFLLGGRDLFFHKKMKTAFYAPISNVATNKDGSNATVVSPKTGKPTQILLNGIKYHTQEKGFVEQEIKDEATSTSASGLVEHFLKPYARKFSNAFVISLGQPFYVDSLRFLLPTVTGDTFRYKVFVSEDMIDWTLVVDRSMKPRRGWQVVPFKKRLVVYVMIEGTDSTLFSGQNTKLFRLVHFECPAQCQISPRDFDDGEQKENEDDILDDGLRLLFPSDA